MYEIVSRYLHSLWGVKKKLQSKIFHLALTFMFMSACLVIWRPLKLAFFSKLVGAELVPIAKLYSLFFLIPLILIYSKLVDTLRRHQLLYVYMLSHAVGGLIFYFFFSHPVYGLANTQTSPDRYLGWAFYIFMESFDAFFATSFWSFADSINTPNDAKQYYGFLVSGSKIGGLLSALALYLSLSYIQFSSQTTLLCQSLLVGSLMLLAAAWAIRRLIRTVSEDYMHGYEVAYQFERSKSNSEPASLFTQFIRLFDGLVLMIKNPYVLGIFSLILFYEIMIVLVEYHVVLSADSTYSSVGDLTGFYALYYFLMNGLGLVISLFGTTPILRMMGIRASLFVFPLLCLGLFSLALCMPTASMVFSVFVCLRALNYALNHPAREILYIPTTKDIKFKAKTWTDAFGSRLAKSAGSLMNVSLRAVPQSTALLYSLGMSVGLTSIWIIITYFLGRTVQSTIDKQQVIGEKND